MPYEYKVIDDRLGVNPNDVHGLNWLNSAEGGGWEFVAVMPHYAGGNRWFFRRGIGDAELRRRAEAFPRLRNALEILLERVDALSDSGDVGKWLEDWEERAIARALLAELGK